MYSFKLDDGREAVVKFKHYGKRKGKPPKSTRCRIFIGEEIVSYAWSRPAAEIAVIADLTTAIGDIDKNVPMLNRLIRIVKTMDGRRVGIFRGDQFCRKEGRTESFRKALMQCSEFSDKEKCYFTTAMIEQGAVKS